MEKDIEPRNAKGQQHGYWKVYWEDLWYKCVYDNGKRVGYEEYHRNDFGVKIIKSYHL